MRLNKNNQEHIIDIFFTLALFCVLAASLLTVVILGANVYGSTVEEMQHNYEVRTTLGYVSGKIRQNDIADSVSIGEIEGVDALVMSQDVYGSRYLTYIYFHDGALYEVFAGEDVPVSLTSGQKIVDIQDFSFEEPQKGVFRLKCTDSGGKTDEALISLRCS